MLRIHQVTALICNGIKGSYKDMLASSGVTVIDKVSSEVDKALELFLKGSLTPEEGPIDNLPEPCTVSHERLVQAARMLFQKYGYRVASGPEPGSFLIDLIAETTCPRCQRPVRVAICCGAHAYSANKEIAEFHHATRSGYNARVYVCPARPSLLQCCREYGIELVDPDVAAAEKSVPVPDRIPLLKGPVLEHEQASG
jgi:predicted Fe-Mo cluster-binding NifX family protein